MQHFADGGEIQVRDEYQSKDSWEDELDPNWDWECLRFRVKPHHKYYKFTSTGMIVKFSNSRTGVVVVQANGHFKVGYKSSTWADRDSLGNWTPVKKPKKAVEMTMSEVSKKLGHAVKIVK